jgi:hypothetical protein
MVRFSSLLVPPQVPWLVEVIEKIPQTQRELQEFPADTP